jgi:hypothetical protein
LKKRNVGGPVLCSAADGAAVGDLQVDAHPSLLLLRRAALLHGFPSLTAAATVSGLLPRRLLRLRLVASLHVIHPSGRVLQINYIIVLLLLIIGVISYLSNFISLVRVLG